MEHLILHRNVCWLGPYGSHQDTKTLFVIETFIGLALEAPIKIWNTLFVIETFVGLAIEAPTKILEKPYLSKRRLLDGSLREEIVTSFGPLDNTSSDRPFHSGSTTSNQQHLK
jgi:hypothetical protein